MTFAIAAAIIGTGVVGVDVHREHHLRTEATISLVDENTDRARDGGGVVVAAAERRGIPVHQWKSLRAPEVRRAFEEARADLAVLAYVTQIVPEPLLAIPTKTSICFHPSLLPRHL